jgi:CubicO group peptidase (beta-lactamase class C family)
MLSAIFLHSLSNLDGLNIALAVLAVVAALTWVAGKLAGSVRRSAFLVLGLFSVVVLGYGIWAAVRPVDGLFLARQIAWGESDLRDFQHFPAREIANSGPAAYFREAKAPNIFQTVSYTSNGEPRQAPLEDLLESSGTTSFIVIKDDAILYEGYFNGYERDSVVTSFSIAKSFTSALVGIAIDEGFIRSVNDRMIDYLPEMKGRGLDDLTIRHLLNMSTGIRYESDDEISLLAEISQFTDTGLSYSYPNLREQALNLRTSPQPVGAEFNYNDYHLQLLGMILERSTGMSPSMYLQEKIWKPLGMEYPASWSLDSEEAQFELMLAGINARAIDFARFGRLFLQNGNWQGRQLISGSWVLESTSPDTADNRPWHSYAEWQQSGGYYKYLWWGKFRQDGGYDFAAHGHLGQLIYVAPREHMVVVRFGLEDGGVDWWDDVARSVIDQVSAAPKNTAGKSGELTTASPEQFGFDSAQLAKGLLEIQKRQIPIHSLTLVGNGQMFLNAYFYPYDRSIYHDLASATKSITTTLIGIAAGQGKLSLDQPVISFFPDRAIANLDERKQHMTVRHLASMRSGLSCGIGDDEPILIEMRATSDWVQFALDRPMLYEPGTTFRYCGLAMHLLSAILTQSTGMPALEFARANLFGPLDIQDVYWLSDPQGNSDGWGDLSLKPEDMAKLGLLFQQGGRWGDHQVVPADWVRSALQSYSEQTGRLENYGYGWWISPPREQPPYFLAAGNGTQRIQVFTDRPLIIVTTGAGFEFDQVAPFIVKAIQSKNPLPVNPAGEAQLQQALQAVASSPAPKPVPAMPSMADSLWGRKFVLEPGCGVLQWLQIDRERADEAVLTMQVIGEAQPRISEVGLDGIVRPSRVGRPVMALGEWWDENTFAIEYYEGPGIAYLRLILRLISEDRMTAQVSGFEACPAIAE